MFEIRGTAYTYVALHTHVDPEQYFAEFLKYIINILRDIRKK